MKQNKKKILSAIAVAAVSAATVMSTIPFAACSGGNAIQYKSSGNVDPVINGNYITVDTAIGPTVSVSNGNKYYVSADAPSSYEGTVGDINDPYDFFTLLSGNTLQPGDIVYVLPGTYTSSAMLTINASGTYENYITLMNAAYDKAGSGYTGTDHLVTLDFSAQAFESTNRGVQIYSDYIYWYGIDICGAGDNGLYVGGSFNTIEYSEFYNNRDTGLQLGRKQSTDNSIDQWPSYNLIKNCTSHNNYDNETYGENADGFAAKLTVGYGNVFDGCIAYRNSDDGWDLYAKSDSGNIGCVIIYNCVAYENGYLEYTRDECNAFYPSYHAENFTDPSANPYMTRDGDGNGFKLGGSIMEGDVIMYNCLSFQNRMHGVTDNSNPGYLKIQGVTSFNNSAALDENGNVASVANTDTHSNIDVARQTYSYNTVNNVLSVRDAIAKSLDSDAYRGTVTNSLLDNKTVTNVIAGSMEGDTKNGGATYTSQIGLIDASAMFETLPVVLNEDGTYSYSINGARDSMVVSDGVITSTLLDTRAHVEYRNADGSVNMKSILAKTEAGEALIQDALNGETAGCTINLSSWEDYTHFYENEFVDMDADSQAKSVVARTKEALTINCDENAVYQDFEVPVNMRGATITWSTEDDDYISFDTENVEISVSSSKYITVVIERSSTGDVPVTITATITYNGVTDTKDFDLILKQGDEQIGEIYTVDQKGDVAQNNGRYIVDQFSIYNEPSVYVKNGLYSDSDKLLKDTFYSVETTYYYQTDTNAEAVQVRGFTPSNAGVYTVNKTVTLNRDGSTGTMSYQIFVASAAANVDFTHTEGDNGEEIADVSVYVYRDGYIISGSLSSATGTLYSVSSATPLDITAGNIKTYAGVQSYDFRDTSITFAFDNDNAGSYYIYYALANVNGDVTSEIYTATITAVDIDTTDKFMKIAGGEKIGTEVPSQTIYRLTEDLDFAGITYNRANGSFSGVFNGLGHTISNLNCTLQGVFYKVTNGTIMNVKFDELTIKNTSASSKVGLVVESTGGYFYNIAFTNITVEGVSRVAALIGHVGGSSDGSTAVYPLSISQISIINDSDHKITASSNRAAGFIGYVQYFRSSIVIDNCQVITDISAGSGEGGGMIAAWEDTATDTLVISQCYYSGLLSTNVAAGSSRLGGMLGYHKGGAGVLTITRCISLATTEIQDVLIEVSVKNASPIMGNYSTAGVASITYCIGLREEYNSDYDVSVFTEQNLRQNPEYIEGVYNLALDTETKWTIVEADENAPSVRDLYQAPYILLNFLGEWD